MSPVEMPPLPVDDLYAVLELTPEATEEAIRASYRRLARLRHPDKNPSDPNATARFQLLQTAYSTLVDAETREAYDLSRSSSQDSFDDVRGPAPGYGPAASSGGYHAPNVNLSSMDDDDKAHYFRKRIADLERTERNIKDDILRATEAMLAAKLSFRKCQESIGALGGVAADYYLPSSRSRHGGNVFVNIISGPKRDRDLYLARQHELDRWQTKVDKLCDRVWSLHNKFDNISMLRGAYINMAGGGDGPETASQRSRREYDERERDDMRRHRDRDRREREREMEQDREWRDIRERERELQDRLDRLAAASAARKHREDKVRREEQAQRDLDAKNERIRRETEKKVEQWEWEAIERQLKKDQQQRGGGGGGGRDHHHNHHAQDAHHDAPLRDAPRGRPREARSPPPPAASRSPQPPPPPALATDKERQEREKARAKDRKKRVEEELSKFAEAEARREADDQERGEREYRERKEREAEERVREEERAKDEERAREAREARVREERMREEREERLREEREERLREEQLREERLREERLREERVREERLREEMEGLRQEQLRAERRRRDMEDKEREWARREHERREYERRDQQRRAYELEREHERLRAREAAAEKQQQQQRGGSDGGERGFREKLRPEEEVIMVYTDAEPARKSRHRRHHHAHLHSTGSDRGSDRSSRADRYADRMDRERRAEAKGAPAAAPHRGRCRHVGVWARVRGSSVTCAGCRRGSDRAVVLVCPGCPKMMCRECLVEGQRASSVRMRDAEGDEYSIRSWHSR